MKEALQRMAIVGAAGKMGKGISLLFLQLIACQKAQGVRFPYPQLTLVDANEEKLQLLKEYLREHLKKFAEKNINDLRNWYASREDLVDNEEMIQEFIESAFETLHVGSLLEDCRGAHLVFEAAVEDFAVKVEIFRTLNRQLGEKVYYFTNTSSIPIGALEKECGLSGRLIGFHFYNPPSVQRLIEVIVSEHIQSPLKVLALDLASDLKKKVIFSSDIAGFIGNGYFIREIKYACKIVRELAKEMPLPTAIYLINRVTQELLLRPMGIFQLIDYVGIDICQHIAKIMSGYLSKQFEDPLIENMVSANILGGQKESGSQKDGFFHYQDQQIAGVYDGVENKYIECQSKDIQEACRKYFSPFPDGLTSWKQLSKDPLSPEKIHLYFSHFGQSNTPGVDLAKKFLVESRDVAYKLVQDGVASSIGDVNALLENGFFHLYGVDVPFMQLES